MKKNICLFCIFLSTDIDTSFEFRQEKKSSVKCYLIDPPGSGLFNKVTRGVMYTREEAEGKRLKNPFDTITEGIGINRLTENFKLAALDGAFRGSDKEAVEMSRLELFVILHILTVDELDMLCIMTNVDFA